MQGGSENSSKYFDLKKKYQLKNHIFTYYICDDNYNHNKNMSEKNPYNILHLHEDCTYEELKDRYRHLSRALHPDKQPPGNYELAQKHFKEIDQAYKSIATEVRRFVFK